MAQVKKGVGVDNPSCKDEKTQENGLYFNKEANLQRLNKLCINLISINLFYTLRNFGFRLSISQELKE